MSENRLLIQAFDFTAKSSIFEEESLSFWCELMIRLYDRGFLYGCFRGDDLMAVAGLCRISEWQDRYLEQIPDQESGSCLYIPFFALESLRTQDPMQMLRRYLHDHSEVDEIIYCEKFRRAGRDVPKQIKRRRILRNHGNRFEENQTYKTRIGVLPPELVNLKLADQQGFSGEALFSSEERAFLSSGR